METMTMRFLNIMTEEQDDEAIKSGNIEAK